MLNIHKLDDDSFETIAAEVLGKLACSFDPMIQSSNNIVLEIFPSVQCYGQKIQDIDLLVFYADYRPESELFKSSTGRFIHSFCATIEVKGHSPDAVTFNGANCTVVYNRENHDVSGQSEKQKHSVKDYIKRNIASGRPPWITNLIWLTRVPNTFLPDIDTNILGSDTTWQQLIDKIAMLQGPNYQNIVSTFSSRNWLFSVLDVFSKRLEASKIDRKRLEAITKRQIELSDRQYTEKLGEQLLIFKGHGGTGKTIRLIRLAYHAYNELCLRVIVLTYNKALVSDLKRLFVLLKIKDSVGECSISVRTIHSFMYEWLKALKIIHINTHDFIQKYEEYKSEAIELLREGAVNTDDFRKAKEAASRSLTWDLILIDESQDWPESERDLLYFLYGHKKFVLADGINQFVRGISRIDWRENIDIKETQIVPLRKSLRLKATLCDTVGHIANLLEIENWNLDPVPESYGGKFYVIEGNAFSKEFHDRLAATAKSDGNKEIDMLFCIPPTWVIKTGEARTSKVANVYRDWGFKVWDGVDPETRDGFPTTLDQYRIVQYESCRGLEGWVVVNFGFDEFYDYKKSNADISAEERMDLFFEEEAASIEYAKKWLMIPLTRAIDTLVIHISDRDSFVGNILQKLHMKYPNDVQWIKYD